MFSRHLHIPCGLILRTSPGVVSFRSLKTLCRARDVIKSPSYRQISSFRLVNSTPANPLQALVGAGGLMLSTYLVLNHFLNSHDNQAMSSISPTVHSYLKGTYTYVVSGFAITALSAVSAFRSGFAVRVMQLNPMLYLGTSMVAIIATSYIAQSTSIVESPVLKHAAWAASMACVGAISLSPLMFLPSAVLSRAALYTTGIVGSLSIVAINAEEDKFLYLGGPLFGGLTVVALSSVASAFLPTAGAAFRLTHSVSLYGGLAVFGGLMLYDTQRIIARAQRNPNITPDYISESYSIYWNVINIFVRMVQIVAGQNSRSRK